MCVCVQCPDNFTFHVADRKKFNHPSAGHQTSPLVTYEYSNFLYCPKCLNWHSIHMSIADQKAESQYQNEPFSHNVFWHLNDKINDDGWIPFEVQFQGPGIVYNSFLLHRHGLMGLLNGTKPCDFPTTTSPNVCCEVWSVDNFHIVKFTNYQHLFTDMDIFKHLRCGWVSSFSALWVTPLI